MFKNFFSKANKDIIPDSPLGFGYKNKWVALKTTDKKKVAEFLNLKKVRESNWEKGIEYGYEKGVFITPPINGWTLALGIDILDLETTESQNFLTKASIEFQECQIFQTHRVTEYHFWGIAKKGIIERLYSFIGDSGENLIVKGEPKHIEKNYNLINTLSKEAESEYYWDREDLDFPNEDTVMSIAEDWSINPTKLHELKNIDGLGIIGK